MWCFIKRKKKVLGFTCKAGANRLNIYCIWIILLYLLTIFGRSTCSTWYFEDRVLTKTYLLWEKSLGLNRNFSYSLASNSSVSFDQQSCDGFTEERMPLNCPVCSLPRHVGTLLFWVGFHRPLPCSLMTLGWILLFTKVYHLSLAVGFLEVLHFTEFFSRDPAFLCGLSNQ